MIGRHQRGLVALLATLLATAPLAAVFEGLGWWGHCAVVIVAVALAAAVARAVRAPVWAQVVAMLAGWVLALTVLFSGGHAMLGVLPTTQTWEHMGALLASMPEDVRTYAAPVPPLESLTFVTAAGVGLVAIMIDVLAVGLRRPALAGLPMLAIYSVPVAVSVDSVSMLLFAVAAVGYLWLLGSDNMDRVRRFGRRFTGDGRDVEAWEPSPLAAAGRRLAVVGVLVAVLLPLAVPGMTTGLRDRFGPGGGPGGSGTAGTGQLNLFAELYGQLNHDETIDLVEVTTEDDEPFYLRLATADQINDSGFQPSAPTGIAVTLLDEPTLPLGARHHRYEATVRFTDAYALSIAPTYHQLIDVRGLDEQWHYDLRQQFVYAREGGVVPPEYEFTYSRAEYSTSALRRARPLPSSHEIQARYAHAPQVPEVQELLGDLLDPADGPYDQVRTILGFFSRDNGFRYDLTTGPQTDAPAIVDFLEHRTGFCVQYAAAMAWLARSADIPARVAFGFTRGRSAGDDTRVMTNRNLHAWTEVYFDGFGWVPFDPTPATAIAGAASPDWAPNPQAPRQADPAVPETNPDRGSVPTPEADAVNDELPDFADEVDFGGVTPPAESHPPWWALAVAAAVVALLAQPALQRALLRRRRLRRGRPAVSAAGGDTAVGPAEGTRVDRQRAHDAWAEMLDTMVDLRMSVDPIDTPRTTATRLQQHLCEQPQAGAAVRLLGQAEEQARYAPRPLPADQLPAALSTVREALLNSAAPRMRLRAKTLPPSTLQRWRAAMVDAAVAVGNRAVGLAELVRRLSPRRFLRPTR